MNYQPGDRVRIVESPTMEDDAWLLACVGRLGTVLRHTTYVVVDLDDPPTRLRGVTSGYFRPCELELVDAE